MAKSACGRIPSEDMVAEFGDFRCARGHRFTCARGTGRQESAIAQRGARELEAHSGRHPWEPGCRGAPWAGPGSASLFFRPGRETASVRTIVCYPEQDRPTRHNEYPTHRIRRPLPTFPGLILFYRRRPTAGLPPAQKSILRDRSFRPILKESPHWILEVFTGRGCPVGSMIQATLVYRSVA